MVAKKKEVTTIAVQTEIRIRFDFLSQYRKFIKRCERYAAGGLNVKLNIPDSGTAT